MINKLIRKIQEKNAPIVVGLDPMLSYLPDGMLEHQFAERGETLEAAAEAIWEFNKAIIDCTYDLIPAVKPQIAMYEQFGVPGLEVYRRTIEYCHEKELIVIGDVKRGDIGSTSAAYATAHLGQVKIGTKTFAPFDEDFATVNPYLGSDGVRPFIDVCNTNDKGIFVLVKTSNPSSGEFQDRRIHSEASATEENAGASHSACEEKNGTPLYEVVGRQVAAWAEESMDGAYSNVGAVVGATYPEMGKTLRALMPHCFILVPGYGAQGGTAEDLKVFFNEDGLGAIVNSSRGIICAYKEEKYAAFGASAFADAARAATLDMVADIRSVMQ